MCRVVAVLHPVHVQIARFQIDLVPAQGHEFRRAQSMAKEHHNNGRIAHPMAPVLRAACTIASTSSGRR